MANLLLLILKHPLQALLFSHTFLSQVFLALLRRLLLPHLPVYQSLRIQLHRAYLSAAALTFPDLTHRLPVGNLSVQRARKVDESVPAYLIPGKRQLSDFARKANGIQRCVVLYAHGGGYARGEARMYLKYMERWIASAAEKDLDLVFFSVEYREPDKKHHFPIRQLKHTSQLSQLKKATRHRGKPSFKSIGSSLLTTLHQKTSYSWVILRVVKPLLSTLQLAFANKRTLGGISILAGLELGRLDLPQPAATILISPWIDMNLNAYAGGNPAVESDYFLVANKVVPVLVRLFIGDRPPNSPDVNPLCRQPNELKDLSPQLIFTGGAEFARFDSEKWAEMCQKAGLKHRLIVEWAQLHIYAMGSKFTDPAVRSKTDDMIIEWIKNHVTQ